MRLLIVGNGPGGVELAKQLSDEYEVTIIEQENLPYYTKPLLNHYIAGTVKKEKLFPYSLEWYENKGIELRLGTKAEVIDRARKKLITSAGKLPYDLLVIYAIGDCAEYNGIICGTAKGAMGHARVLANLIRDEEDRYAFEFRSTVFKFGDFPIAIIGETKGNGNWLDNNTKVFLKEGKVVGAVIIKDVKRALELERKIKSRVSIDEL